MIRERILVDTGPLVALLAKDDADHVRCVEQSKELPRPFLTTWPILTEAAWLLRNQLDSIPKLMDLLRQQLIQCVELDTAAGPAIAELAHQYANIRPDFADLSLVYTAEREGIKTVFTLDRRDFSIYRDSSGQAFGLLP